MISVDDFITLVFCHVDDFMRHLPPLRTRGFAPALSDSEVITMEIVGEFLEMDTDKGIGQYFRRHWLSWFPKLTTRETFVRQAANLWRVKQQLQLKLAEQLGAFTETIHLVDGIPIPLCVITRAPRCKSFRGEAAYGYCAAKKQHYYGFHGHLLVSSTGVITAFSLSAANGNERDALWDLVAGVQGLIVGDKGYLGTALQQELAGVGINLQTALRRNMHDERDPGYVQELKRARRLIETVIGQLSERLNLEKVWARDMWHLTSRLGVKS